MRADESKIHGLRLSNFTCFADLEVRFSGGINVIIGENGLGKTHLLKVLYFLVESGIEEISSNVSIEDIPSNIKNKYSVVNAVDFNRIQLLHIGFAENFGVTDIRQFAKGKNDANFDIELVVHLLSNEISYLYIPVYELLSWYKGFVPSYENRESSIDNVYYLLAKKLAPLPLKGEKLIEQKALIQELENELGFEVVRDGDEFMIAFAKDQVHNTKLVANGINKLAQLIYLIMNGSLTKNSIIFWDEPEAGLNPKYIVLVAKFLQTLAKAGCQIFVATHDYLLSHTLSLAAEYRDVQPDTPPMRFHALYKTSEGTQIESADTLPEIQHNSILDEYSRFYKAEEDLFYKSMKVGE